MPTKDSGGKSPEYAPGGVRSAGMGSSIADEFRRGSPAAVREVHQRVERIIAFSRFRIPLEAREGLRQEALIQIWQGVNRTGFDASLGFWGFVQTVAARRCIDWMRGQRPVAPEHVPELVDTSNGPLQRTLDREQVALLRAAIAELPDGCRELVRLRIERHRSYAEIAEQLGKSEQALRAQMYRCVARLKDTLSEVQS